MRVLILVAGAILAIAGCIDRAPSNESNVIQIETVPDDGNWTDLNTEAPVDCAKAGNCEAADPEQID